ncbi:MAG: hypothetical protein V1775_00335 [Bacteroidota bacterium]
MEQLIAEIFELIRDYRSDEGLPHVQMTPTRIRNWINQFDAADRVFILTELKAFLEIRYCSKSDVREFLKAAIEFLTDRYSYSSVSEFLLETVFLDLQRANKSQPTLLKLMKEVLHDEFQFDFALCGTRIKKNYIYIDDVLCTGNTLFQDMKTWVNESDSDGQTFLSKLQEKEIKLIFLYLFIHETNFYKKKAQFRYQIAQDFESCFEMIRGIEIENGIGTKLEVFMPTEENQPDIVQLYQRQIEQKVNAYCDEKKIKQPLAEFYRPSDQPTTEQFFSSVANRKKFEDILLKKGIEILNAANTNIPNLRALGYSLPSLKNFGFGTLCVTWRNVPNNCPITFWYTGGGNFPLFVKHQT